MTISFGQSHAGSLIRDESVYSSAGFICLHSKTAEKKNIIEIMEAK